MRTFPVAIVVLSGVVGTAWCSPIQAGELKPGEAVAELQAELSAEQPAFRLGEPMPIRCTLRNVSAAPLQFVKWCRPLQPPRISVQLGASGTLDLTAAFAEQERRWVLWDTVGQRVDSQVPPQTCEGAGELMTLAPGEAWSAVEDLAEYYPGVIPGSYVVRVRYEQLQHMTIDPPLWTGMVSAEPLTIQVEAASASKLPE